MQQGFSHDGEHFRLDAVADVLFAQFGEDFGQEFNVGAEHVEGRVEHLDEVGGVHEESFGFEDFGGVGVDVDGESKEDLGLWAFDKETEHVMMGEGIFWQNQRSTHTRTAERAKLQPSPRSRACA